MRKYLVLGLLILPLLVAGCSKAPAEAALKAADEAIARIQPEAEKFVPEQFKGLTDTAATARVNFEKGDYAAVIAATKDLPAKANDVMAAAVAKREELTGLWTSLQASLPAVVQGLTEKVGALEAMKKLPKGFDSTQLTAAKTQLGDITGMWTKATEAYGAGDIKVALATAGDVKVKAEELTSMLEAVPVPLVVTKK